MTVTQAIRTLLSYVAGPYSCAVRTSEDIGPYIRAERQRLREPIVCTYADEWEALNTLHHASDEQVEAAIAAVARDWRRLNECV